MLELILIVRGTLVCTTLDQCLSLLFGQLHMHVDILGYTLVYVGASINERRGMFYSYNIIFVCLSDTKFIPKRESVLNNFLLSLL